MTLRARRTTIICLLSITILIFIAGAAIVLYLSASGVDNQVSGLAAIRTVFTENDGLFFILLLSGINIATLVVIFRYFRRSSIPEVFLAMVAVSTFAMEAIAAGIPLLHELRQPLMYFEFLARTTVFFQLAGMLGLFFVSLFMMGIHYQKVSNILLIQIIIALLFAYALPVRTTSGFTLLTHSISGGHTYAGLLGGIVLLAYVNLIGSYLQQKESEGWMTHIGCGLLLTGRLLTIILEGHNRYAGLVLITTGLILFSKEQYQRYLWN